MLVSRAGIHRILVRSLNGEVPDQSASVEILIWACTVLVYALLAGN